MVTLLQVASSAGVPLKIVRRIVDGDSSCDEEKVRRVLAAVDHLGYVRNRRLLGDYTGESFRVEVTSADLRSALLWARKLGGRSLAEPEVEDVAMSALMCAATKYVDRGATFSTVLFSYVRAGVSNLRKKKNRWDVVSGDAPLEGDDNSLSFWECYAESVSVPPLSQDFIFEDLISVLDDPQHREVVRLYFVDGYSFDDIASLLSLGVRSRVVVLFLEAIELLQLRIVTEEGMATARVPR